MTSSIMAKRLSKLGYILNFSILVGLWRRASILQVDKID